MQAEAQGGAADATTALIPATEASNAPQCNHELVTLPTHATERPQPQLTIAATDTLAQNQLVRADPAPNAVTGGLALVALPTLPTAEPKETNAFDRLCTTAKGARPEATTPAYAKMDAVESFKTLWEKFHGKLPAGLAKLQTFRSLYEETRKKETEKRKRAASEATGSTPTKRAAIEHPTVHQV